MAQALEKMNVYPNLGKMFSFAQKMVILFQNSVFGQIQFSQKSLTNRKKETPYPFTTSACATHPNNILLLLKAPAERAAQSAELPRSGGTGKETKILEKGTRSDRGSPEQNESPIPDLSNAP